MQSGLYRKIASLGEWPMNLLDRLLGYDRFTTDRVLPLCCDLPDTDTDRDVDIGNRTIRHTVDHFLDAMEPRPV